MEISNFNFDKDKNAIDKGCKKIEKSPTPEFSRYQQPLSYIKKSIFFVDVINILCSYHNLN